MLPVSYHEVIFLKMKFFFFPSSGRRKVAHITGLSVSATTVEMITDTAIVTLNCLNSWPVMPDRKLTGTNTAQSTSDIATNAPPIPLMAFLVASFGGRCSCSMMRSTFSTTTIASSTTIPMASTRPSSVMVLSEKPKISITPNVPISEMGTAIAGTRVALQLWRERNTTRITSSRASNRVL